MSDAGLFVPLGGLEVEDELDPAAHLKYLHPSEGPYLHVQKLFPGFFSLFDILITAGSLHKHWGFIMANSWLK